MMTAVPKGLRTAGRKLWRAIDGAHTLDDAQLVQLEEACRAKDRLDKLDEVLRGEVDVWMRLTHRTKTDDYELHIGSALTQANATANVMKQLLAALRLPDEKTGKVPQYRGARGAQRPSLPGGKVSSLDRARDRTG